MLKMMLPKLVSFPGIEGIRGEVGISGENEKVFGLGVLVGFKRRVMVEKEEVTIAMTDRGEVLRATNSDEIE